MKKIILLTIVFVLSLLLASCGSSADEATTNFCGKLGDFGTELTEFGQELTRFDTVDEAAADEDVNQAMAELQQALSELKASAPEDVDTDALEEAADELEQALRSMSEGGGENLTRRELAALMADTLNLFNSECNVANIGRPG